MPQSELHDLRPACRNIRASILRMAHKGKTPHVSPALSCVELLAALYFSELRIDPEHPRAGNRDRFLLSKGHACMALYATLFERGFFPKALLDEYAIDGGSLAEHPGPNCAPGIEAATGSLGHGLPIGTGLALAAKLQRQDYRTFVLLSDGECNEGTIWEAAIFASRYQLDNLIAIVDYNKWSAMDRTDTFLEPFAAKWEAFGWGTAEVDGHNLDAITTALGAPPLRPGRPTAIIAHTVKGKGVSFMENDLEWHYKTPGPADLEQALAEVEDFRDVPSLSGTL